MITQFGASLTVVINAARVVNYAPRVVDYTTEEHIKYRHHSWQSSYENCNMFIIHAPTYFVEKFTEL